MIAKTKLTFSLKATILQLILAALLLFGINLANPLYSAAAALTAIDESNVEKEEEKTDTVLSEVQNNLDKLQTGHSLDQRAQEAIKLLDPNIDLGKVGVLHGETTRILIHKGNSLEEHHWDGNSLVFKTVHEPNSNVYYQFVKLSNSGDLKQVLGTDGLKNVPHSDLVTSQTTTIPSELNGVLGHEQPTKNIVTFQSHDGSETYILVFPNVNLLKPSETVEGEWFIQKNGEWTKRKIDISKKEGTELIKRSTNTFGDYSRAIKHALTKTEPVNLFTHQDQPVASTMPISPSSSKPLSIQDVTGAIGISSRPAESNNARKIGYIGSLEQVHQDRLDALIDKHNNGGSLSPAEVQEMSNLRNSLKHDVREQISGPLENLLYYFADKIKGGEKKITLDDKTDIQTLNQVAQSSVRAAGGLGLDAIGARAPTGNADKVMKVIEEIQPDKKTRDLYMGSLKKGYRTNEIGHVSSEQADIYFKARQTGKTVSDAMQIAGIKLYAKPREVRRAEAADRLQQAIRKERTTGGLQSISQNIDATLGKGSADRNKLHGRPEKQLRSIGARAKPRAIQPLYSSMKPNANSTKVSTNTTLKPAA